MRTNILGYGQASLSTDLVRRIQHYAWSRMIPKTQKEWDDNQRLLEDIRKINEKFERVNAGESHEEVFGPTTSPRDMLEKIMRGQPYESKPRPTSDDPRDWEYRLWTERYLIRKVERWK